MAEKVSESPVRIIGSRELHQNLPGILRELENAKVRYVLTVHGKPRAVLIGAEPYLSMIIDGKRPSEAVVGLQLTALLGGNLDSHSLDDLERALDQQPDRSLRCRSTDRTPPLTDSLAWRPGRSSHVRRLFRRSLRHLARRARRYCTTGGKIEMKMMA